MIKIYIESGVAAAQKNNKRTTPEQDFIEKFIEHHFADKKANEDFIVCGLGGKDTLEASAPLFRDITDEDSNIVIFDCAWCFFYGRKSVFCSAQTGKN